jgi:hypothetical protein
MGGLAAVGCGGDDVTVGAPDASSDVTNDMSTADVVDSATPDAGDAGDAESPALAFAKAQAAAICTAWLGCCPGAGDAGQGYNLAGCEANLATSGWEGTLPEDLAVYGRGHITFDQAKAAGCLSAIQGFPCGSQTPAQWGAITQACKLIIQGTIAGDAGGCISSFECAPGTFCDPTVDGGLCAPLATKGQPCNTKIASNINPTADQMCSYLASGQPALFCDLINNGPTAATCQPLLGNGANCTNNVVTDQDSGYYLYYDDQACQAPGLCDNNSQCNGTAPTTYPYSGWCTYYAITDAGAD